MGRAALPLVLSACTTLGPMPATTGISAMPIGRPGMDFYKIGLSLSVAFGLGRAANPE